MKRDLATKLLEWKGSPHRKPLLLQGARQVGKTWLLKSFGRLAYQKVAYFNFEEDRGLDQLFEGKLDPERLVRMLSLSIGQAIEPEKTLIVFDEIQESNRALSSLKYFQEKAGQYHVAAAGSLLGIMVSRPASFPVGKVDFLRLYPLSFFEFLDASGESVLRQMLQELREVEPLPDMFHARLIELLRIYYVTGGMPEPVRIFLETNDIERSREAQKSILTSYLLDFSKHVPNRDIPRITEVWRSIPVQLARENRRFTYRSITDRARGREYADAVSWLEEAGLILRAFRVSVPRHPLASYANRGAFKAYLLDVGLLGALSELPPQTLLKADRLFTEFHGAFVENYVAQQIALRSSGDLYYWASEGKAEVDFLYASAGDIFPLEVKAGVNPKSRSLRVYEEAYSPPILSRANLLNLRQDGRILNYPLYAVSLFPDLAGKSRVTRISASDPP
jgi:predicted AAA+ superfamily ATPase